MKQLLWNILGVVALVITGSGGGCNLTAVAQCGACSVSCGVVFACQVVLLSTNELPPSFKSWCKLGLLRQMVQSELVNHCTIQGDALEKRVCGVVVQSIIFAEVQEELDLVSWDVGNTCLILQSPSI